MALKCDTRNRGSDGGERNTARESEADIGKPLAPTLVPKFKELNPFCDIKAVGEVRGSYHHLHASP